MAYILNTTNDYHIRTLNTLGWELTLCNALHPEDSPCRRVLKNRESFGTQLFHSLEKIIPFDRLKNVLEVGGGLGYLMRDFLSLAPHLQATMLDVSPFLLQKQKETLSGFPVNFREMDFLKISLSDLRSFDFIILNEILGDFPTLVYDESQPKQNDPETIRSIKRMTDYVEEFDLEFAPKENINIGAMEVVEKLCGADIPYIYLSEHSCEASMHNAHFPQHQFTAQGVPERIPLKGHDEFTLKFSHLQKIARFFRYRVIRGQYIDLLPLDYNDRLKAALQSPTPLNDEQEIIQQFVHDLYKYEYLVLINDSKKKG
ncbi:MAG TPA: class I SAM-dependent methyltransferase [Smithellaceae bacterium]|nr:class I SAM-dependent methyltransferase [Smithellaceae bacterium]